MIPYRCVSAVGWVMSERVVFAEELAPSRYLKLVAAGEIDGSLLDGLAAYAERQRARLRRMEQGNEDDQWEWG